jgi:8-amino-7-oxononanoate synthase
MKRILQLFKENSENHPDSRIFTFHDYSKMHEESITYRELYERSSGIAHELQNIGKPQSRVIIGCMPGIPFIYSLMGCLMSGMIAVPFALPQGGDQRKTVEKLFASVQPEIILTNTLLEPTFKEMMSSNFSKTPLKVICVESIAPYNFDTSSTFNSNENDIAYLQYTSGSTQLPKGVEISFLNLYSNIQLLIEALKLTHKDRFVSWLPHIHNMGLVGGILAPLIVKTEAHLMNPFDCIKEPFRWLKLMSDTKATYTGSNSVALELCLKTISQNQLKLINLEPMRKLVIGGDYVQKAVLEAFSNYFAPCGFKREALTPGYGLAECTMMVSIKTNNQPLNFLEYDKLNQRAKNSNSNHIHIKVCASVGTPSQEMNLHIVDPIKRTPVGESVEGEIWVAGNSVAKGYWRAPEMTQEVFKAYLADDTTQKPYLRTGDLGILHNGELYITGRIKEVIIIHGINHYPEDIETTARRSHEAVKNAPATAFANTSDEGDALVVIQEILPDHVEGLNTEEVIGAIREAIVKNHSISPQVIALVEPKSLPRTYSGKLQRLKLRDLYLSQAIPLIGEWKNISTGHKQQTTPTKEFLIDIIINFVATTAKLPREEVNIQKSLNFYGIDSLSSAQLLASLQHEYNVEIPLELMNRSPTIESFAQNVTSLLAEKKHPTAMQSDKGVCGDQKDQSTHIISQFREYRDLEEKLAMLKTLKIPHPYFREDEGIIAGTTTIKGKEYINFSTYNYLGLSGDPRVSEEAKKAIDKYGTSVSGSRLLSGQKPIHAQLEKQIANFLGVENALAFVGGHATNETTLCTLVKSPDLIICDSLVHNSIYQGALLSGAKIISFAHNDMKDLERLLQIYRKNHRRCLIVVEGVYSMEGDITNLPELVKLKHKYQTMVMIDEAHSFGVIGKTGRGTAEYYNINPNEIDIWMGTLSKSLGSCGGFIAGSNDLIHYLKYVTPGFVYAAGITPQNCSAAHAALNVIIEEPERIRTLNENSKLFLTLAKEAGLNTGLSRDTAIIPIIVGDLQKCFLLSHKLFMDHINVHPITYPVVPKGTDRLRFFISSEHTEEQIKKTVEEVRKEIYRE